MTTPAENQAFSIMVASIYAARLNAYMVWRDEKPKESTAEYRRLAIEFSISDAVRICEAVERDFPTKGHAA